MENTKHIDGETLTRMIEAIGFPPPFTLPDYDWSTVEWWKNAPKISTFEDRV